MVSTLSIITSASFGIAMFLWGHLEGRKLGSRSADDEYANGFADGWEASEDFDSSIRVIWGGQS